MHYHISDAVLIELCRIEIYNQNTEGNKTGVLIELCRIEITKRQQSLANQKKVLIELCRIEIAQNARNK